MTVDVCVESQVSRERETTGGKIHTTVAGRDEDVLIRGMFGVPLDVLSRQDVDRERQGQSEHKHQTHQTCTEYRKATQATKNLCQVAVDRQGREDRVLDYGSRWEERWVTMGDDGRRLDKEVAKVKLEDVATRLVARRACSNQSL